MKQKKTITFQGFTPATFQFFAELEENNYKPWFEEHRAVYENEALMPLKALAAALTPFFASVDGQMDFRPQKMISRIYRDIRFSSDKSPYKKHLWISFQRTTGAQSLDWMSFPGFFLEVGKEGCNYGMGLFEPKKVIMDRFRDQVAYAPDAFRAITEGLVDKYGFAIEGRPYKRPLKNDLDDYFQPWIQRGGIYLVKSLTNDNPVLLSDALVAHLEKDFGATRSLYDFLLELCD